MERFCVNTVQIEIECVQIEIECVQIEIDICTNTMSTNTKIYK